MTGIPPQMINLENQEVSAGVTTLMRQASMTVSEYLDQAIERINGRLGKGYAEKNPELVAAFIKAASNDFHSGCTLIASQNIQSGLNNVSRSIGDVANEISQAGIVVSNELSALSDLAEAISTAVEAAPEQK